MDINQKELAELISCYERNRCVAAILSDNADREKHYKVVTVERQLKRLSERGQVFSRGDVVAAMKHIQRLGVASFVTGRRGAHSRMEWA